MAQQKNPSIDSTDEDNNRQPKVYPKNSMDRFGDDLYELLLSYFLLEDRFRCECVSKQFQRTAFKSIVDIEINDCLIKQIQESNQTIAQTMVAIAVKCPKIEIIDCRGIGDEYEEHIPQVLNTFRDNCRHLREIYCDLTPKSAQTMPSLGPLVTRIGDINDYRVSQAFTHCHRLSQLSVQIFHAFNALFVNNLQKFVSGSLSAADYHWSEFVTRNQSLQCLVLESSHSADSVSLTEMCGQLSRLTQLRELTLGLVFEVLNDQMSAAVDKSLRTIGVNCKQLNRLSLKLFPRSTEETTVLQISLDSLRVYHRLKRLHLTANAAIDDGLLDQLRHCKRLTDLKLHLLGMKSNVLKDMHIKCPRLQYLSIKTNAMTRECLSHVSRLPALQMLVIHCHRSDGLRDNDFTDVLTKSPKLKTIKVRKESIAKYFHRINDLNL